MKKKYKIINLTGVDKSTGLEIGDIVEVTVNYNSYQVIIKLPKRLYGNGHNADRYKKKNYWFLLKNYLEEIKK